MRILLFISLCLLSALGSVAQDANKLYETGIKYLQTNDYGNAIIVLKSAVEMEPKNKEYVNNLGLAYALAGQFQTGYELMMPLVQANLGDDRSYQVCAWLLRGGKRIRETETVYALGLKAFPNSGLLLADYGEYLDLMKPGNELSLIQWERGIQRDPSYPGNYFFAAKAYAAQDNFFWAALYAEMFINLESYSNRTVEMKNLLFDGLKRMYAFELSAGKLTSPFEKQVAETFIKQESLAKSGLNPETLTAIRTRFVLDWYNGPSEKFPFQLFEHHKEMLQQGIFEAYNQWLFGSVDNLEAFQNWTKTHPDEYVAFNQYRTNHLFHVPVGEYYK